MLSHVMAFAVCAGSKSRIAGFAPAMKGCEGLNDGFEVQTVHPQKPYVQTNNYKDEGLKGFREENCVTRTRAMQTVFFLTVWGGRSAECLCCLLILGINNKT